MPEGETWYIELIGETLASNEFIIFDNLLQDVDLQDLSGEGSIENTLRQGVDNLIRVAKLLMDDVQPSILEAVMAQMNAVEKLLHTKATLKTPFHGVMPLSMYSLDYIEDLYNEAA